MAQSVLVCGGLWLRELEHPHAHVDWDYAISGIYSAKLKGIPQIGTRLRHI